jgi:hypothetical protein
MYTNLLKQIQETYQPIYQLIMVSFFSGTTLTNNKINQFQSLIYVQETNNTIEFKTYNLVANSVSLINKVINFNNLITYNPSLDDLWRLYNSK